jgi:hypothetical protein
MAANSVRISILRDAHPLDASGLLRMTPVFVAPPEKQNPYLGAAHKRVNATVF